MVALFARDQMTHSFYILVLVSIFCPRGISSSQCELEQLQTCMRGSSTPDACAASSGCESSINEYFTSINAMNEPVVFKYTASPNVALSNEKVSLAILDRSEFRDSALQFPLSRIFTVTRLPAAGNHGISLMMPTFLNEAGMCQNKHIALTSLADHILPSDSNSRARVENCQTMVLTSICICFVNMNTEAGDFVMTSKIRHPLTADPFDNDLRRRRLHEGEEEGKGKTGEGRGAEELRSGEGGDLAGQKDDDLDVDFITHTALVILTVVAFIGNGLFLTYVFCISAV